MFTMGLRFVPPFTNTTCSEENISVWFWRELESHDDTKYIFISLFADTLCMLCKWSYKHLAYSVVVNCFPYLHETLKDLTLNANNSMTLISRQTSESQQTLTGWIVKLRCFVEARGWLLFVSSSCCGNLNLLIFNGWKCNVFFPGGHFWLELLQKGKQNMSDLLERTIFSVDLN